MGVAPDQGRRGEGGLAPGALQRLAYMTPNQPVFPEWHAKSSTWSSQRQAPPTTRPAIYATDMPDQRVKLPAMAWATPRRQFKPATSRVGPRD